MRLSIRFVLLVIALLSGIGAGTRAGFRALRSLDSALNRVVSGDMERLLAITHTRRLFRSLVVLERDYLLSSSSEERAALYKNFTSTNRELDDHANGQPHGTELSLLRPFTGSRMWKAVP